MEANIRGATFGRGYGRFGHVGAALAVLVLAACGNGKEGNDPAVVDRGTFATLKLNTLENCDAYKTYLTDALVEQYRPGTLPLGSPSTGGSMEGMPAPATPTSGGGTASDSNAAPSHVTGTNNQESGVDEPDIVKTDANGVLYIARGNFLRIVAGHPARELKELAALDAGGSVYDLFLDETNRRLVLFAARYDSFGPVSPPPGDVSVALVYYQRPQYIVSFVDVSNPAQPVLTARWTLDGYPLDARRVDTRVHFVLSDPVELPAALANDSAFWKLYTDYYNAPNADAAKLIEQQIVGAIRSAMAAVDASELLPSVTIEKDGQTVTAPIVGCGGVSAPKVQIYPSLLTVASFDTDGANLSASAITAHGATVYASPTHLYITQYSGGWFGNDASKPQTMIHQFSVSGAAPKYVAAGLVDGWVSNSFNLSEYNGDLRVATSTATWINGVTTRTNDLFILRDNGAGELAVRGAVREFGKDESIFSARFLGARGFVVTFRQVDPLFAFDLSDPDNPKLMGELTIPGFSTYMHPLGNDHLLTIGRDGSWNTQLQIFNVSNLAKPERAHSYPLTLPNGYSYSEAEYDHHAFTFDNVNNVLAIPLSYANYSIAEYFNGIAAFKIDAVAGISEIVRVDHADLANKAHCETPAPVVAPCDYWYAANPRRSVIMTAESGVTLYSISDAGVKATDLAPPNDTLGSVVFPLDPPPPIIIGPAVVLE